MDLIECLKHIDPVNLDYTEWINVGMALKHEGYTADDWEQWSAQDARRYHPGESFKKWATFNGNAVPVTGATIVQMAKDNGMQFFSDELLDWDSEIGSHDNLKIVDKAWLEETEINQPTEWHPAQQVITYLQTLFEAAETVGFVTESWQNDDGKYLPTKGSYTMTCGELIEKLTKCNDDIGAVLGDYKPEAGAWVRFNPLDGNGVKNTNVTDYRYALVESDTMPLEQQNSILRELELPIACLVYSGGKSVHAIVKIDAGDYNEYRKRVDYLYDICAKNGLEIDRQNKNPSRLSRLPGATRNGSKQFIIDTNIGKNDWKEWKEWIESVNDNLPDPENLADVWDNLPELAPTLIDGVLRQGHKMLVAGPSKAGKSYALIELCCAIAEGKNWLGFSCAQGKILYVNLEVDRPSCLRRFKDVYKALGWVENNRQNIEIWNLRGKAIPMDKLAPKLIRRAAKKNYIAIIIDPIYKIITGDENSADQMANFCNQFDKVCTELGCAVIYCHHHSKGAQGGKASMDRASGSGVFARDPDALLDLIELQADGAVRTQHSEKLVCGIVRKWLVRYNAVDGLDADSLKDDKNALNVCRERLSREAYNLMFAEVLEARQRAEKQTAWRIEGTLREFERFEPINMWFDFPIHKIDITGALKGLNPSAPELQQKRNFGQRKTSDERKSERAESLVTAFNCCQNNGIAKMSDLANYMGVTEMTVRRHLNESPNFWVDNGETGMKN